MSTIHRSRSAVLSIVGTAAVLTLSLAAPVAAQGLDQDQVLVAAPAGPSWDDTSGYGAVEANRAAHAVPLAPATITTQVSADVRWAPLRMVVNALGPLAAAATVWDESSGYGAVEASRADR
jgi:hypothetical protein